MKKTKVLLLIILTLSSCASILNGKKAIVKISADKESKIVFETDTISINREQTKTKHYRSKKPLKITVLKDSLKQDFYFESKLSDLFWLNIITNNGLGIFVDLINKKRFTYQANIHFATDTLSNKIVLSNKKVAFLPKKKLFIYTSPLQAIDFFSIPMLTLGSEFSIHKNFSISVEYGTKFNTIISPYYNIKYIEDKAITYRFETKWYNGINLTNNVHLNEYLSLEFRKIKSQYNSKIEYYERNNSNQNEYVTDDFATRKNVTIFNIKYGMLIPIGKKLYLDFYSGIGVRTKQYEHQNLEYDKSIHQIYSDNFSAFAVNEFKNYTNKSFLNLSLGFKFGIKL